MKSTFSRVLCWAFAACVLSNNKNSFLRSCSVHNTQHTLWLWGFALQNIREKVFLYCGKKKISGWKLCGAHEHYREKLECVNLLTLFINKLAISVLYPFADLVKRWVFIEKLLSTICGIILSEWKRERVLDGDWKKETSLKWEKNEVDEQKWNQMEKGEHIIRDLDCVYGAIHKFCHVNCLIKIFWTRFEERTWPHMPSSRFELFMWCTLCILFWLDQWELETVFVVVKLEGSYRNSNLARYVASNVW